MTNHTEISRKLALAIGWKQTNIQEVSTKLWVLEVWSNHHWRVFDYRSADVIWPIAKHFDMFPTKLGTTDSWFVFIGSKHYTADTPELAVALAVIGGAG